MRGKTSRAIPADLARVEGRFAEWRRRREFGARIPESLWRSAMALSARHGLNRTAKALRLDYYSLKQRVEAQASAAQLLTWWRGHWRIENQLHWVRDVVFGEDACRIQSGGAPQNMAAFRNAGISFLRFLGCTRIAKTLRQHACRVDLLLAKLGIPKPSL